MLLRRAFALYGATPSDEFAGTVQFVVAEHGAGHAVAGCEQPRRRRARPGRPAGHAVPAARRPGAGGAGRRRLRHRAADPAGPAAARGRLAGRDHHRRGHRLAAVRRAGRASGSPAPVTVTTDDGSAGDARPGHRRAARRDRADRRRGGLRLRADGDAARRRRGRPRSTPSPPRSRSRSRWPAASACA